MKKTIQLTVIDDEVFFRKGLVQTVDALHDMDVTKEVSTYKDLLKYLKESKHLPDVILIGLRVNKGIAEIRKIIQGYPDIKCIVLSADFSYVFIIQLLEIGVACWLSKSVTPSRLEKSTRTVVEKGHFYTEEVLDVIRAKVANKSRQPISHLKTDLSPREKDVLELICKQYTNPEIAQKLNISYRTVEGHRANLLRKLQCKNMAGLVAIAILRNLVQIDLSDFYG